MDAVLEEAFRDLAADVMAQGFLTELLLTRFLKDHMSEYRAELVEAIKKSGRRTDHFGQASSDQLAELHADVTVRMHSALDGYLKRAMARLAAGDEQEAP